MMRRILVNHALAHRADRWSRVAGIACPTLCLWGAADRSVPVPYAVALAARLRAPLRLLPGLRHFGMWEAPDLYAGALMRFWDEHR